MAPVLVLDPPLPPVPDPLESPPEEDPPTPDTEDEGDDPLPVGDPCELPDPADGLVEFIHPVSPCATLSNGVDPPV